jgi:hypothetical protein
MISSLVAVVTSLALGASAAPVPATDSAEGLDISTTLQNILSNTHNSDAYKYPTDLTRGIVPVSASPVFGGHPSHPTPFIRLLTSTLPLETNPLTQRLLARHSILHGAVSRLHLNRGRRVALQRHTVRWP